MKGMWLVQSARIGLRSLHNYVTNRPLVISFEVTHSCTCDCLHCDRGGPEEEDNLLEPEDYTTLVSLLNPSIVQVSGGEPLLRSDVLDVVKAIKSRSKFMPYIIFVTNASLLNEEKYIRLRESGVDRFSFSLDFPDERHDGFRRHPGLYAHLNEIVPRLAELGYDDIALNSAITRVNMPYLIDLADKAKEWGVAISYSAYGSLRTGDESFSIYSGEDLEMLRQRIRRIIQLKKEGRRILNPVSQLMKTYEFFKNGRIPDCKAGRRFLVVRPNGYLIPCSMRPHNRLYSTREEMLKKFSKHNSCEKCYVAIRAYSDKSFEEMVKDNLSFFFSSIFVRDGREDLPK